MNCKPVFLPAWQTAETNSQSHMVACQAQQVCKEVAPVVVSDEPADPIALVLQSRFLKAWQKMLDEGVDWFAVQGERDRGRS
jgi:hypothetical protein